MNPVVPAFRQSQSGLSMVEMLVAMAISLIISFGVVNLFLQSKSSFIQDEEISRLQENGRWALRYISRELSMTGFYGNVVNGGSITTALAVAPDCGTGWAMNTAVTVEHLDNVTDSQAVLAYVCLSSGEVLPGTDILAVRRTKDTAAMVDGTIATAPADNTVYLRLEDFGSDARLVRGSDLTLVDKTAGSGIDTWEYQPQLLYVRPYANTVGDGIPTLCTRKLTQDASDVGIDSAECLVEGVENLQVEYGLDNSTPPDFSADYYISNPTAAELRQAVNARIFVLARSVNEVNGYRNDKSYQLGNTVVAAANDGYYRRVMQTTVVLRNGDIYGF